MSPPMNDNTDTAVDTSVKDPVCGMSVSPDSAHHAEYQGRTWHFCSRHCRSRFEERPEHYIGDTPAREAPANGAGTAYTCPMHPDVRRPEPDDCPACGMALEPETPQPSRVEYTCPMHPEVVQDAPGACPKCGMALEPRTVTADTGPSTELIAMTRRFRVGVALSVPLLILAMGGIVLLIVLAILLPIFDLNQLVR